MEAGRQSHAATLGRGGEAQNQTILNLLQVADDKGYFGVGAARLGHAFGQAVVSRRERYGEVLARGIECGERVGGVQGQGLACVIEQLQAETGFTSGIGDWMESRRGARATVPLVDVTD